MIITMSIGKFTVRYCGSPRVVLQLYEYSVEILEEKIRSESFTRWLGYEWM